MSSAAYNPNESRQPLFDVSRVVAELAKVRLQWRASQQRSTEPGGRELPSKEALEGIVQHLCGVLFPMRLGPADLRQETEDFYVGHTLDTVLHALFVQVRLELRYAVRHNAEVNEVKLDENAIALVRNFSNALPGIRQLLDADVLAAYQGDPAARSVDEVLLCYPGVLAMVYHRIAHKLYTLGVPLLARIVAELSHAQTGVDIHPGASIGAGFFVDHGTGVVIGETAVIGERVRLYQAVTLGAKSFPVDDHGNPVKGQPRHPVLEDDVVIYAGATILGRITIGKGSSIGGNVWLTHSVPAGSHITQAVHRNEAQASGNAVALTP
jgi:serine O-acetyltransferase